MIAPADVISLMLAAVPSFRQRWDRHRAAQDGREAGYFNDVGEFAHHIVELYSRGGAGQVRAGLDLVERMIVEGDKDVQKLATVGVLEDIQNLSSHRSFGYSVFEPWLGERSLAAWHQLEETWKGKTHLAEVAAAERGVKLRLRPWWKFWVARKPTIDIEKIEDPELREIAEGLLRWERSPKPK